MKKWIAILLLAAIALTLTACGGDDKKQQNTAAAVRIAVEKAIELNCPIVAASTMGVTADVLLNTAGELGFRGRLVGRRVSEPFQRVGRGVFLNRGERRRSGRFRLNFARRSYDGLFASKVDDRFRREQTLRVRKNAGIERQLSRVRAEQNANRQNRKDCGDKRYASRAKERESRARSPLSLK